ncbi:hypothetical protein OH76DRAFT_803024 [Lentinus brumalis]|uniref:Uncharacterized protein n=1 Tax=Lentinus brumalis TaxID=2498619 RepID=A0A371D3B7_9APHY|nr:hypothetical protein OH76DRAFT_803024 [Polyporus brumalis]
MYDISDGDSSESLAYENKPRNINEEVQLLQRTSRLDEFINLFLASGQRNFLYDSREHALGPATERVDGLEAVPVLHRRRSRSSAGGLAVHIRCSRSVCAGRELDVGADGEVQADGAMTPSLARVPEGDTGVRTLRPLAAVSAKDRVERHQSLRRRCSLDRLR